MTDPVAVPLARGSARWRRRVALIWLLIALLVLVFILAQIFGLPRIARTLERDTAAALDGTSYEGAEIDFDGREGTIEIDGPVDAVALDDRVEGIDGVRWANVRVRSSDGAATTTSTTTSAAPTTTAAAITTTTESASPAVALDPALLSVERLASGAVVLTGTVASDAERQAIVDAAEAQYGADQVDDRLTVAEVEPAGWLGQAPALFEAVDGVTGRFDIDGDGATITGTVPDEETSSRIEGAWRDALGSISIDNQLVVEPSEDAIEAAERCSSETVTELGRTGSGTALFETAAAILTADYMAQLDSVIETLAACPDVAFEVGGHTDSRGAAAYNQLLSQERADAVVLYLVSNGVGAERLTAVGYGESNLLVENELTPEDLAQNRRIDFTVTSN